MAMVLKQSSEDAGMDKTGQMKQFYEDAGMGDKLKQAKVKPKVVEKKLENMSEEEQVAAVLQMTAKKELHEMSEEEQLEAIMRISMEEFELQQTSQKILEGDVGMNDVAADHDDSHQEHNHKP